VVYFLQCILTYSIILWFAMYSTVICCTTQEASRQTCPVTNCGGHKGGATTVVKIPGGGGGDPVAIRETSSLNGGEGDDAIAMLQQKW